MLWMHYYSTSVNAQPRAMSKNCLSHLKNLIKYLTVWKCSDEQNLASLCALIDALLAIYNTSG